jgi:transposase-like protein
LNGTGEIPKRVRVRTSKYLNNTIEQDHRRIKQRLGPMPGLKSFGTAAVVIGGIELAAKIMKNQFRIGGLPGRPKYGSNHPGRNNGRMITRGDPSGTCSGLPVIQ